MRKIIIVDSKDCYDMIFLFDSSGNRYELSVKLPYKEFKKCLNRFDFRPPKPAIISHVSRQHILWSYFILREFNLNVDGDYLGSIK